MTLTDNVQLPLAGMVRPLAKLAVFAPAVAVTVVPPPHVVAPFGDGAITTPEGNVSTSGAVNVATVAFALDSVTVNVDTPPAAMVEGLNALVSVGFVGVTIGANAHTDTLLVSSVTAPVCANARPDSEVPVFSVILLSARMLPTIAVAVPSVAELPTCQNTLHA